MQNGSAELPLASLMYVLSFYGENLAMRNSTVLWPMIALQTPLDTARCKLSINSQKSIPTCFMSPGINSKLWRSDIANCSCDSSISWERVWNDCSLSHKLVQEAEEDSKHDVYRAPDDLTITKLGLFEEWSKKYSSVLRLLVWGVHKHCLHSNNLNNNVTL